MGSNRRDGARKGIRLHRRDLHLYPCIRRRSAPGASHPRNPRRPAARRPHRDRIAAVRRRLVRSATPSAPSKKCDSRRGSTMTPKNDDTAPATSSRVHRHGPLPGRADREAPVAAAAANGAQTLRNHQQPRRRARQPLGTQLGEGPWTPRPGGLRRRKATRLGAGAGSRSTACPGAAQGRERTSGRSLDVKQTERQAAVTEGQALASSQQPVEGSNSGREESSPARFGSGNLAIAAVESTCPRMVLWKCRGSVKDSALNSADTQERSLRRKAHGNTEAEDHRRLGLKSRAPLSSDPHALGFKARPLVRSDLSDLTTIY